jgi:hypothetical protein
MNFKTHSTLFQTSLANEKLKLIAAKPNQSFIQKDELAVYPQATW